MKSDNDFKYIMDNIDNNNVQNSSGENVNTHFESTAMQQHVRYSRLLVWALVALGVMVVFYWLYVTLIPRDTSNDSSLSSYPPEQQKIIDYSYLATPTDITLEEREELARVLEGQFDENLDIENTDSAQASLESQQNTSFSEDFEKIRGN